MDSSLPPPPAVVVEEEEAVVDPKKSTTSLVASSAVLCDSLIGTARSLRTQLRSLASEVAKIEKQLNKAVSKSARRQQKGGFTTVVPISDAMCAFLGVPSGTKMTRSDVTRKITEYIKHTNICDANDRRVIKPDAKLMSILSDVGPDDIVTYFNIQHHLKHNYLKT